MILGCVFCKEPVADPVMFRGLISDRMELNTGLVFGAHPECFQHSNRGQCHICLESNIPVQQPINLINRDRQKSTCPDCTTPQTKLKISQTNFTPKSNLFAEFI